MKISRVTVGQRDNPAWHLARRGRLTASNFGNVLKAKRVTPSLLKRLLGEYDLSRVKAVQWGVNNEEEAIKAFTLKTGKTVKETGIWFHSSGILGASPDGIVDHENTKEEEEMIKGEISGHNVSVIFDGTTRLGEALVIVVRFITADWEIKQRLVRLQLIVKSLKGDDLAREIITVLAQQYNVQNSSLCAAMRDGASVNGAAMRTVKVVFPKVVDVRCFSHAIDGIDSHLNIPTLRRFLQLWNALFGHSPATRIAWKERMGISNKSYAPMRWWSWWEVANQIMLQFAEIHPFLQAILQEAANKATLRQLDECLPTPRQSRCSRSS